MGHFDTIFHYGEKVVGDFIPPATIEKGLFLPLIQQPELESITDPARALRAALENPVGDTKPVSRLLDKNPLKNGVVIIVDDYTRPNIHTRLLLPLLVSLLGERYSVPEEKISLLIATGTHRAPTDEQLKKIIGAPMMGRLRLHAHDCDHGNRVAGHLDGVEILVDNRAFQADLLLALTDIDNHYFAGVAGGPKILCPGICGRSTIEFEHLKMFSDDGFAPNVELGVLDGNPVFECKKLIVKVILDAFRKNGTEAYCLAAINDTRGRLVYLQGGDFFPVHRNAAEVLKKVWTVTISRRADLVIGGAAHLGMSVYQAGKGIHAASRAVKKGGRILAVAPCDEGIGDEEYIKLLELAKPVLERRSDKARAIEDAMAVVLDAIKKDFRIGKQKVVDLLQILRHIGWGHLHMLSNGIPQKEKELLPIECLDMEGEQTQKKIREWILRHGSDASVTVVDNPGYMVVEEGP
jgi:nickel-dependent lactate racemase